MCGFYGGEQIVGKGTVFSSDGRYVVTAGERGVYVYSAVTARLISEYTKHRIIQFATLTARAPNQIAIATSEGVFVWDFLLKRTIASCEIRHECGAITDMVFCSMENVIILSWSEKGKSAEGKILRYRLPDLVWDSEFCLEQPCACGLRLSASGKVLCLMPKSANSCVVLTPTDASTEPWNLSFPERVHCVCLDHLDRQLAVGCSSGKILIYHTFAVAQERFEELQPATLHWHSSPVAAIQFSSDGLFLFSIGEEGVLVIHLKTGLWIRVESMAKVSWHLSDLSMKFVPRVGLNVTGMDIHPIRQNLFLLSFEDNSFKIVDSSNYKVPLSVYGIAPLLKEGRRQKIHCYCIQPRTGYLVLPIDHCHVQFYDLSRDKHVTKLQVVPRMAVSKTKQRKDPQQHSMEPFLQSMAFNPHGTVLVTVTARSRMSGSDLKTDLRFFESEASGKYFYLSTEILDPHKGSIASLCASPVDDLIVTTSQKGEFRLWTRQSSEKQGAWHCKAIGSFRGPPMGVVACGRRLCDVIGCPLGECCFSDDGSVLAVAYPSGVGLWDPTTLTTLGHVSIPDIPRTSEYLQLCFVTGSDFLVGCLPAASLLVVWDLQSLSIHWASMLAVDCLTADSNSKKFAVTLREDPILPGVNKSVPVSVAVFDPADSTPCAVYAKFRQQIQHLHFSQSGTPLFKSGRQMENGIKHTHAPLVVLSASHQYSIETETGISSSNHFASGFLFLFAGCLGRKGEEEVVESGEMPSAFEMAFGGAQYREDAWKTDRSALDQAVRFDLSSWSKIPSHALPSTSVLSSNLLEQIFDKG